VGKKYKHRLSYKIALMPKVSVMPKQSKEGAAPLVLERYISPIAVRPEDAARALGISQSLFEKLVKEGYIDPPVSVPATRIKRYCWQRLQDNFRAWHELAEDEPSAWDVDETL
jgi:hypothetical protein